MDIRLGVMKLKVLTINFITNFQPMKTNDESKICLEKKEIQSVLKSSWSKKSIFLQIILREIS